MVVDVDDQRAFDATAHVLPPTARQATPSGGSHWLYAIPDGEVARQTVKEIDGIDTRIGGKGWVGLYAIDSFAGNVAPAPDFVLGGKAERVAPEDAPPITTRAGIVWMLGHLARGGLNEDALFAALKQQADAGRITESDASRPWTDEDFHTLAREAAKWTPAPNPDGFTITIDSGGHREAPPDDGPVGGDTGSDKEPAAPASNPDQLETFAAGDLLQQDIPDLVEVVEGLVPEGVTILVAAPKIGKSWLAYQIAVAVASGGTVLGRQALKGGVLYLALEDGKRRAKNRIQKVLAKALAAGELPSGQKVFRDRIFADLDVAFVAGRGEMVVKQVETWLTDAVAVQIATIDGDPGQDDLVVEVHPRYPPRLVIIDVLQKIRPKSTGRRNPYELDAEDVGRVIGIGQRHPGMAILVVHHSRKMGSDDFIDAASGTHGITGTVDTTLVMSRNRHEAQGKIDIVGRDIVEGAIAVTFDGDVWTVDPAGGLSAERRAIFAWLQENGPAQPKAYSDETGFDWEATRKTFARMYSDSQLVKGTGGYDIPVRVSRPSCDSQRGC